jgi:hypothetical protein
VAQIAYGTKSTSRHVLHLALPTLTSRYLRLTRRDGNQREVRSNDAKWWSTARGRWYSDGSSSWAVGSQFIIETLFGQEAPLIKGEEQDNPEPQ